MATEGSDSFHSPRGLAEAIRKRAGEQRAPVGPKRIRELIETGKLAATFEGNRWLIAWSACTDYQRSEAEAMRAQKAREAQARAAQPSKADQLDAEVGTVIKRQAARGLVPARAPGTSETRGRELPQHHADHNSS